MNSKLNEKILNQVSKKLKVVPNIRTSNFADNLAFKGKVAIITIDLNSEDIKQSLSIDELKTLRLYRLFNSIIVKLFAKHRNYMTMRSNSYELVGLINLAEDIDFNLTFELMTMLNSFRQEWNDAMKEMKFNLWNINLSVNVLENAYICESLKEGLQFLKKDDTHLENELILINSSNKPNSFNPTSFYVDKSLVEKLKTNYQAMCIEFDDEFNTSEAKASFTDKFEW